ncbi:hypothetical protein [Halomonas sp. B23F22_10]|uniref:hypothetical protein n=1 Tax=Halomonas sp. B23F22_10 TaxID=3459515 RepID=UPI00373F9120
MSAAIDINSTSTHFPQFDPEAPPTKLEALLEGECEIAAEQFVDWLADEAQRETLYHMAINRLKDDDIKAAAEQWAKEGA